MKAAIPWLTFLAPLLIVAAFMAEVQGFHRTENEDQRRRNALHAAETARRRVRQRSPDVLVLGNSATAAAVNDALLQLRFPTRRVMVHTSPAALPPTWYLMLTHQVVEAGVSPDLTVLMNPTANLLAARPVSQLDLERLAEYSDGDEPELDAIMGVDREPWASWWRWQLRRAVTRDELVDAITRESARLWVWPTEGWIGRDVAELRVTSALRAEFPPVVDPRIIGTMPLSDFRVVGRPPAPHEGVLPALASVVHAWGGTLAVVITPTLDPTSAATPDDVAALRTWCHEADVPFVDLSDGFEATSFVDPWHLNPAGATQLTERLIPHVRGWLRATSEAPVSAETIEAGLPLTPTRFGVTHWPEPVAVDGWVRQDGCVHHAPLAGIGAIPSEARSGVGARLAGLRQADDLDPLRCDGHWQLGADGLTRAGEGPQPEVGLRWTAPPNGDLGLQARWWPPGSEATWVFEPLPDDQRLVVELEGRVQGEDREAVLLALGSRWFAAERTAPDTFQLRIRTSVPGHGLWPVRLRVGGDGVWVSHLKVRSVPADAGP